MRVTQNLNQAQFISALNTLEANLSQTQNQISTNLSFTTPSQNPVAAGAVTNYNQALLQSQQYGTNANSAQTQLSVEDTTLSQVQNASHPSPTALPINSRSAASGRAATKWESANRRPKSTANLRSSSSTVVFTKSSA